MRSYSNLNLSSTHARHKARLRDEIRWSPFIECLWITRMSPDHAWCTITGTNEMKWMRWLWINGGINFVAGENERNPEKNLPRLCFVHEAHMEWSRCELGTPAVGGKCLTDCDMEKPHVSNLRTTLLLMSVTTLLFANLKKF